MRKVLILFLLGLLFPFGVAFGAPYLILSAMQIESKPILKLLSHRKTGRFYGIDYTSGVLNKQPVIVTYTGIGAINAGIVTAILINRFHPNAVIFSGVAGSLQSDIHIGAVVIGTEYLSVNFGQYTKKGESFPGLRHGPIRNAVPPIVYKADPTLLNAFKKIKPKNKLFFGVIATDQHFPFDKIPDQLLSENHVYAVAMEDYGVAHVCWLYKVPMISIRAISDNIILKTKYTRRRAIIAAKNAAEVLSYFIKG